MEFVNELGLVALGSRMKALSERLYAIADEVYRARGITIEGRWFPVLRLLHDRGPRSIGEIAEAIGQTHSAVSQLASRLVREGWLRAAGVANDKRVRRLSLTTKAKLALRDAKPAWRALQEVLESRCSDARIDMLSTLDQFAQVVDASVVAEITARASTMDRSAVQIIGYRPDLGEHFYRLNAAWLSKYFYIEDVDHRVLSHPQDEILAHGGAILFALTGDIVVGTCALKRDSGGVFELTKMAVDERYQGLGIGRLLIEAAIAEFKRLRGTQLFLETNAKLAPAIHLYESTGFEHQSTRKADSQYQRSDVYMIWQEPAKKPAGRTSRRKPSSR